MLTNGSQIIVKMYFIKLQAILPAELLLDKHSKIYIDTIQIEKPARYHSLEITFNFIKQVL